jgi:mono/diheme cytochrome c family protein
MRKMVVVVGTVLCATFALLAALEAAAEQDSPGTADAPTYSKDVAPILFSHCTQCHRPGELAPMSLLTYKDARPWAKAIHNAVLTGVMPPWHADPAYSEFANARRLTDAEKTTIARWVVAGAPEGNPADLPTPPTYVDGWQIGEPDVVLEMEPYAVPAEGTVQYEWMYIPTGFTEPRYVQAIEIRPGNRKLVHHVLAFYRSKPDRQRTSVLRFDQERQQLPPRTPGLRPRRSDSTPSRLIATYAPGTLPQVLPAGSAMRFEPGGEIELQVHYSTNGTAGTDRTKIGFIFSKDKTPVEVQAAAFFNAKVRVPARARDVRVDADVAFQQDATVWGLFPHTHLRGKKWEYRLVMPDGTERMILAVPRYDFNWQTYYMFREPLQVPKGSRIVSSAWYDNSGSNRFNPDPDIDVSWGDQTWEEMQYTGLLYSAN